MLQMNNFQFNYGIVKFVYTLLLIPVANTITKQNVTNVFQLDSTVFYCYLIGG